jgi:hypothetical protein
MDIYSLIAKLRRARRQHALTAGAQGLFMELISICNEEYWPDHFKCKASELCSALGVTEKTLASFRYQLIAAGLLGYLSGKHKHAPSHYSLNGDSFDSSNGVIFYYQSEYPKEYQSDHPTVEKIPNLIRHKKKDIKQNIVVDEVKSAREIEFDQVSNAYFDPPVAHIPEEKEKSSAKKEKPLPTALEMMVRIDESGTCHWRNVIEFYLAKGLEWDKMSDVEKLPVYDQRMELFKKFYASKQDNYKIRLPSISDIASNFYNWVPTEQNREKLQILNQNAINKSNAQHKPAVNNRQRTEDKRHELKNLQQGSTEYLRRIDM